MSKWGRSASSLILRFRKACRMMTLKLLGSMRRIWRESLLSKGTLELLLICIKLCLWLVSRRYWMLKRRLIRLMKLIEGRELHKPTLVIVVNNLVKKAKIKMLTSLRPNATILRERSLWSRRTRTKSTSTLHLTSRTSTSSQVNGSLKKWRFVLNHLSLSRLWLDWWRPKLNNTVTNLSFSTSSKTWSVVPNVS